MSDNLRKGLGEQASEKITPDSQKSTTQKASENVSGFGDKVAGAVQPEGNKSATQKAGDATRSGGDSAQDQGKGVLGSVQDSLSSAGQTVSDTLSGNSKQ